MIRAARRADHGFRAILRRRPGSDRFRLRRPRAAEKLSGMSPRSIAACLVLGLFGCSESNTPAPSAPPPLVAKFDALRVEASCGMCQLGMKGEDCALAIRTGDGAWYVDGVDESELGDAHSDDGICNAVRHAIVSGEVREGRFVATKFELEPAAEH